MREAEKGGAAMAWEGAAVEGDVTVVTDADYRTLFLPCDALEESEEPAQVSGPVPFGGSPPSRAAGR